MWFANQTRPDIANAVRAGIRHANTPREAHWRTAIGILEKIFFLRVIVVLHFKGAVDLSW